jgi:glycosyltransferase involved in cell wall biosynthesis
MEPVSPGAKADPLAIAVVIPACDEAGSLAAVLRALPRADLRQIIVCDNGSRDNTAQVARDAGADVVFEPVRGYGHAMWRGVREAIDSCDVIVMLDAANKEDPAELPLLLEPLLSNRADFVLGSRVRRAAAGALTPPQRFGNGLTAAIMRVLYGVRVSDLASFRAIRAPLLKRLDMRERTFGWPTEMIVKAAICKARIAEVDVSYRPRRTGKSKVSGSLSGSIKAGVVILRTVVRYVGWRPDG